MGHRLTLFLVSAALLLAGCATPQQPVALNQDALKPEAGKIGIAMSPLPKVDTRFPGAGCLLCIIAASAANSGLTAHAQTLPVEDLSKLKNDIASLLDKKGVQTYIIEDEISLDGLHDFNTKGDNIARKDFTPFREKYGIDKLVVVSIYGLGFLRNYSAYFPTSDPLGFLSGIGYMVNLTTNQYEWYTPVVVTKASSGEWDEPPHFPGLTNAYFQTLEAGKDVFLRALGGN